MARPWTAMYWSDYAADTSHLSMTEQGAYINLMRYCYIKQTPVIPAKEGGLLRDTRLAYRIANANRDDDRNAVDSVLDEFFEWREGVGWFHKRIAKELKLSENRYQSRVAAAKRTNELRKNSDANRNGDRNGDRTQTATVTGTQPQPQPHKEKNPLNPPTDKNVDKSVDKSGASEGEVGVDDFGKKGGGGTSPPTGRAFNIMHHLNDQALEKIRDEAPGWDVYYLAQIYNNNVNSGKMDKPKFPSRAFPVWCGKYTHGKQP